MKQLTLNQISLAKKPKQRGVPSASASDNYTNIHKRTVNSISILQEISELLPYLEENSGSYTHAKAAYDFYFTNILSIIEKSFPIKKQEGFPIDDTIFFDESKINAHSIKMATRLIKISSDYLLQAFPANEYEYLHPKLENMVKEIDALIDTFERNRELQKQIALYQHQIRYFEPISMGEYESKYNAACLYCRETAMGDTEEKAIINIKHLSECRAEKLSTKTSLINIEKWYKVVLPKRLRISWEDRKKLDKLRET